MRTKSKLFKEILLRFCIENFFIINISKHIEIKNSNNEIIIVKFINMFRELGGSIFITELDTSEIF